MSKNNFIDFNMPKDKWDQINNSNTKQNNNSSIDDFFKLNTPIEQINQNNDKLNDNKKIKINNNLRFMDSINIYKTNKQNNIHTNEIKFDISGNEINSSNNNNNTWINQFNTIDIKNNNVQSNNDSYSRKRNNDTSNSRFNENLNIFNRNQQIYDIKFNQ